MSTGAAPSHRKQSLALHALRASDVGWVGGEAMVARHNWVRLEVRDRLGALRFVHEVDVDRHERCIREARLAGGRYLVVEEGDIMADGLRVWDFERQRWSFELAHSADVLLHDVHPCRSSVAIDLSDGASVGLLDLESHAIQPFVQDDLLDILALSPLQGWCAYTAPQSCPATLVIQQPDGAAVRLSIENSVHSLAWAWDGSVLHVGEHGHPGGGRVVTRSRDTLAALTAHEGFAGWPEGITPSRDGRHLAVVCENTVHLVDVSTDQRTVFESAAACAFHEDSQTFAVAQGDGLELLPLGPKGALGITMPVHPGSQ